MPLSPGQVLNNRYRIVKLLGQGGFGAVYRAWDMNMKAPCAVKENFDTSQSAQTQFEREATLLFQLRHPNLPRVYDHFLVPGQGQYLVMDFIEGQDLQTIQDLGGPGRLPGSPLPEYQALAWIGQVGEALVYMHRQKPPVIHRDIKPANIVIAPDGQAVLVDFGIAKAYDPRLKTTAGARAVTPGYSPIEQYGQGTTDARSDVYSLGATLYALLTGQVPAEATARAVQDTMRPAILHDPRLSAGTAKALSRALQLDPGQRFQSAAEFATALRPVAPPRPKPPVSPLIPPASQQIVSGTPSIKSVASGTGLRIPRTIWIVLSTLFVCVVCLIIASSSGLWSFVGGIKNAPRMSMVTEATPTPIEVTAKPTEAPIPPTEEPAAPTEAPTAPPEEKGYKIGFLAGVADPFYFTMQRGAQKAAADLGVELVVQIPDNWNATVQTPMLDAMVARGDLDFIFLAPVDKEAMIAPLQKAYDSGLPLLTVDTFIGDGDYANGPVQFPLSFIASDNFLGGEIACEALVKAIGEKGKIYIQNVKPGISSTDAREEGCKAVLGKYPDVTLVGVDYNDDDPAKAQAQVEAKLTEHPDLGGIFGTNVFSAQGAGQTVANKGLSGKVKVVAFDATETAIEMLKAGTVDMVIAQKPSDMGYLAVEMAVAYLDGVTSIPKHIPTGYAVITRDNMDDPAISQFFYTADVPEGQKTTDQYKIGFLAGVADPFYFTMQRGAEAASARFGNELIVQIPDNWNATVQTPMLDALVARGDLNFLFLAPVDKEAMIAPLQKAYDSGLPLLTVDTFIGDGDYANGQVQFPLSFIASDNKLGGVIACEALIKAIGGKGKVYIQNVKPGISSTDAREEGCKEVIAKYPDVTLVGVDYNDDDPAKAQAQVEAKLTEHPDLGGIFGTNVFSAQGAGQTVANKGLSGKVKVVAFDATETAIEMLKAGTVDMVIAQKPSDMGYLATMMAMAYLNGVTSIPKHIPTGYAVITRDNMDDPEISRFFYTK